MAAAAEDTPVAATVSRPRDTIVRRVPIVYRRPYMLQRATPALHPLQALSPLDTQLVVCVYDQRGIELAGVRVRWTLAGDAEGATLRVVNAVTDSLGLSRAEFSPAPSAASQGAIGEVPDLGKIEFSMTVPANKIRIASTGSLWTGEETEVSATLVDFRGNTLRRGELHWGVSDSARMRATAIDGTHARVHGIVAGGAEVIAWDPETGVRGFTRLAIRPSLTGKFVTLDDKALPRTRAAIRVRGAVDSVTIQDGAFTKRLEVGADEEVVFDAEAAGYQSAHLRLSAREFGAMTVALIPEQWRIEEGSLRGQTITVDARLALQRPIGAPGSSFWRIVKSAPGHQPFVPGWRDADFPLKIAFNRARSRERVSAEDSIAFWAAVREVERELGAKVFVPDAMRSTGVVPVEIEATGVLGAGHTFVTWNAAGEQYDAVLTFPRAASLRDADVVQHELLHLLGFGHTTAWSSIMEPVSGNVSRLTPTDVALVQIAMRLRRFQERLGAVPGLPQY